MPPPFKGVTTGLLYYPTLIKIGLGLILKILLYKISAGLKRELRWEGFCYANYYLGVARGLNVEFSRRKVFLQDGAPEFFKSDV